MCIQFGISADDKGEKANFRKACKPFSVINGQLVYKMNRLVISSEKKQQEIIHDIHVGLGDAPQAKALSSHRGRDATYDKIKERFFWQGIKTDVEKYIAMCHECQKAGKIKKVSTELQSIPIKSIVMHQVGIDISNLPESNGFKHLVVCIDYFSKWTEAKALSDKKATSIAKFLYEVICRHGCIKIQINEFVNDVCTVLHEMTGTEQRVTSAYHPQANGLCERQNRTIKVALVKVLNENPTEWPDAIDGVLFAHRVSRHSSTKYSPYFLLYNREPVLPVGVKYSLVDDNSYMHESDENKPFDEEMFDAVLSASMSMRKKLHNEASENILQAQKKQRQDYNRRHQVPNSITVGQKVLLLNQKRMDRKGGKFTFKFLGPYTVLEVSENNLCTLQTDETGVSLKKKPSFSSSEESDDEDVDDGTSPFTKVYEKPLDFWTKLPNETVGKILTNAVKSSENVAETFRYISHLQEIISTQKDFILSRIYIPFSENELKSFPRRSILIHGLLDNRTGKVKSLEF